MWVLMMRGKHAFTFGSEYWHGAITRDSQFIIPAQAAKRANCFFD